MTEQRYQAVLEVLAGVAVTEVAGRREHWYQFTVGSPSTTMGTSNVQGATTLTVASGTSFTSGSRVVIGSGSVDGGTEVLLASGAGWSTTIRSRVCRCG